MKFCPLILVVLVTGIVLSCIDSRKAEVEKIVTEWNGKTIHYPDIECTAIVDSFSCPEFNRPYKILLYTDSIGCMSCNLRFRDWKKIIFEADSLLPGQIEFLFYFHPKKKTELIHLMKRDKFVHPIYIDDKNEINRLNHFPDKTEFQCFLLDADNKVISIGNPVLNPPIWELYKSIITGEEMTENPVTSILLENPEIELQDMEVNKKTECSFFVTNTGNKPLIINEVKGSCGCTVASWEEKPILPGNKTEIRVEVVPDEKGYLKKSLDIFCNIPEGRKQITVKGVVK